MANDILGTNLDDIINGTADDDLIKTFEGDDVVIAGGGDDEVYTGLGEDRLEGGAGDDYLVSNEGNDILLGGAGSDRLFGCEDDDILDGGAGQDFVNAGTGNDILIFNAAENSGSRAPDYYSGLEGFDTLVLELTQAEFTAAQSDIDAFLAYVRQTTGTNGESTGAFFRFQSMNLAVQEVENLEIVVAGQVVFTTNPSAEDDSFDTSEAGVIDGSVADNDAVNPGSTFTIVQNVGNGTLVLNADGSFTFDTNGAFDGLGDGETATETFTYRVSSPNAPDVTATATITITGQNDAPVVSAITADESEDAPSFIVDLLAGASDADNNDTLSVTNVRLDDGTSVVTVPSNNVGRAEGSVVNAATVVNDGKLSIDLSNYQYLAVGETLTLTVSYDVSDGTTTTPNTATLTIIGENDIPTLANAVVATIDETDAPLTIDMLAGASDIDASDVLSVSNFTVVSGNAAGIVQNGSSLTIDGSAYSNLNAGDSETIIISYEVIDGNGGSVTQTATITVNGEGTPPPPPPPPNSDPIVAAPIVITLQETDGLTAIDLLAGASDPDGDMLTAATPNLISGNGIGAVVGAGSLSVDGTAYANLLNAGDVEQLSYLVAISDGNGGTVVQSITVNIIGAGAVNPVNGAPIINFDIDIVTLEDGSPETIFLTDGVSDPDGDTLSIANLTGLGTGLTYDAATFQLDVDPSSAFFQSLAVGDVALYTLTYDVIDGNGGSVSRTTTIEVEGENDDPVVAAPLSITLQETDGLTSIDLFDGASDVDNGAVLSAGNLTLLSGNDVGAFSSLGSLDVDGTAYASLLNAGDTEVLVYEYEISDGEGGSVTQTVTVTIVGAGTVSPSNQAPVINSGLDISAFEDDSVISVFLTDNVTDPDGDTLSIINLTGLAPGLTYNNTTFELTVDPSDSLFQDLAVGDVVIYTLNYDIIDGNGGSVSRTTTVEIEGVNDDPVAGAVINVTYDEDDAVANINTLLGASDIDMGDTLSAGNLVILSGDGMGLTLSGNTLVVTPTDYTALNTGESEVITFSYEISDGNGGVVVNTGTVTINGIGTTNQPPVSNEFAQMFVTEGAGTTFAGAAQGASDPDGDPLTAINLPTLPSWLTFDPSLQRFTADENDPVFDSLREGQFLDFTFTYDLSDSNGGTVGHGLSISVEGTNDAPVVAAPLTRITQEDFSVDFLNLLTGATDVDSGDILSIRNVTGLNSGFFVDYVTGGLNIETGDDAFDFIRVNEVVDFVISYEIHDLYGGFTTQTATISIEGFNDNPELEGALSATVLDEGTGGARVFNLLQGATDPENTAMTVSNIVLPSFLPSGVFTFDATAGTLTVDTTGYNVASVDENFSFSFDITDADGGVTTQQIDITIQFQQIATTEFPNTSPITLVLNEDSLPAAIDLLQGASDPDGDTLSVTNIGALPFGLFFNSATNSVGILNSFFQGLNVGETFNATTTYTIEDGNGGFVDNTLTVTITGVNDDPLNSGVISAAFNEDDGLVRVDLLEESFDRDRGDVLSVDSLSTGGLQETLFDGARFLGIELDASLYQSLAAGESADFDISFLVEDLNGGSVTQTGTIIVFGANDVATVFGEREFVATDNDDVITSNLSNFISEIDTNDVYTLDSVTLATGSTSAVFNFSGGVFSIDPSQFGLLSGGSLVTVDFNFTFTSGPDTISSTFTVIVESSDTTPQEPIDPTVMVYVSTPDPDKPIEKTGPDGVYADGLDSDWFAADTDDGFDFATVPEVDIPVLPTLDDNLLNDDLSAANSGLTKAMALAQSHDGDPPLFDHVFDGLSLFVVEVDFGAL